MYYKENCVMLIYVDDIILNGEYEEIVKASGGFRRKDPGGKRSEGPILLGGNEDVVY